MCVLSHSVMPDSATPGTTACHAPLSMEFSRQEYWNGLSFPTPGDLPNVGTEYVSLSPALSGRFFITGPPGKQKTPWLLPNFGNYELSCYKDVCTSFCTVIHFQLLWGYTKEHNSWIWYGNSKFSFARNRQTIFQSLMEDIILHSHQK